jgi:hypothetical protein
MEYKVITSNSVSGLNNQVGTLINNGWKPVGSHQIITTIIESVYANTKQLYKNEYSQTMIKE